MKENTKNLLTSVGIFALFVLIAGVVTLTSGCTFPFSGNRDVSVKLQIMGGNNFEWTSKVSGEYSKSESPLATDARK